MESIFEASSRIEKGLCSELGKAYKNNDNYCIRIILLGTFILLIGPVLYLKYFYWLILIFGMGIFALTAGIFADATLSRKYYKVLYRPITDFTNSYYFNENELHICTPLSNCTYGYLMISHIYETKKAFVIKITNGPIVTFYKDAMTKGKIDDFKYFISLKTGNTVKQCENIISKKAFKILFIGIAVLYCVFWLAVSSSTATI